MAEPTISERSARLAGLLARTALADQVAFAELYRQTSAHLYAVALRILREPAMAEETLQEAFVSVWHHRGTTCGFDGRHSTREGHGSPVERNV